MINKGAHIKKHKKIRYLNETLSFWKTKPHNIRCKIYLVLNGSVMRCVFHGQQQLLGHHQKTFKIKHLWSICFSSILQLILCSWPAIEYDKISCLHLDSACIAHCLLTVISPISYFPLFADILGKHSWKTILGQIQWIYS